MDTADAVLQCEFANDGVLAVDGDREILTVRVEEWLDGARRGEPQVDVVVIVLRLCVEWVEVLPLILDTGLALGIDSECVECLLPIEDSTGIESDVNVVVDEERSEVEHRVCIE